MTHAQPCDVQQLAANDDVPVPKNDLNEIRRFLELFLRPCGWVIGSALKTKTPGRAMRARHFGPDAISAAAAWAFEEAEKNRNIYHIPAEFEPPGMGEDPPGLEDITGSHYLWVDIDPKDEGQATADERARILEKVTTYLPGDVPEPTGIIWSGNGAQVFWRTNEFLTPIQVAAKNRWLIRALGGDQCAFNPNRLMRMPGTVNEPTETKLRKGRKREQAYLHSWNESRSYPANTFPELEKIARPPQGPRGESTASGENILVQRKISDFELDELAVPPSLRALMVTGADPTDPARFDGDRSRALFSLVTALIKHGLDDATIYSLILDRDFAISHHIYDQAKPEAYARRQIERARLFVVDPVLAKMNEEHAVIKAVGGKCMVTRWVPSPLDPSRRVLQLQTTTEFAKGYMNKLVGDPDNLKPLGLWWLQNAQRREYDNLVFRPGDPEVVGTSLNLWRGFAVAPAPGDWSLLKAHILNVLASGNEAHAEDITKWAAFLVQNPAVPAEVALVLKGGRGTGKGTFGAVLKAIFGQHALQVSSSRHVAGNFNAHLRDTCFLFSDESYFPGSKGDEGTLKRLLTEDTIFIEAKGRDGEEHPNRLHVLMASNEEWVVPAGMDERRFAVYEVSDAGKRENGYFERLKAQLDNGGREAFLHDLLNMDLEGWHPRKMRQTTALLEQKLNSLSPLDEWYFHLLQEGSLPCSTSERPDVATNRNLFVDARIVVPRLKDVSDIRLGRTLTGHGCTSAWVDKDKGKRFPPLREARAAFEKRMNGPIDWDRPDQSEWRADPATNRPSCFG